MLMLHLFKTHFFPKGEGTWSSFQMSEKSRWHHFSSSNNNKIKYNFQERHLTSVFNHIAFFLIFSPFLYFIFLFTSTWFHVSIHAGTHLWLDICMIQGFQGRTVSFIYLLNYLYYSITLWLLLLIQYTYSKQSYDFPLPNSCQKKQSIRRGIMSENR